MLEKTYQPNQVESRLYAAWEESGAFACGQTDGKPYTIVIPPPNVTGSLHMGHALNNTLQDILIRYERMRGRDVLWQPGTDHAGIATQMVVERQLAQQQIHRRDLGREKFLEKVWAWKGESGGIITGQLRRLGASCDWSRERFTMDDGLSAAVRRVFVQLYKQGLIYKDKRLVNWDVKFQTAISDLEVEQVEVKSHLWHLKYPIEELPGQFIVVATTRPETMLGDTGVAVHPDDERYKHLVGKHVILPLIGRRIPIVADAYSDPEKGTGAVKMTPAHDFNDFEVGKRCNLALVNVLDAEGHILPKFEHFAFRKDARGRVTAVAVDGGEVAPDWIAGIERFAARKKIVAVLEEQGLVDKIEPNTHTVPHGDRSATVIEPWLTDQWYVDAATLAKPAIEAVERGEIVFVPRQWEKTYFEWMRNIQPWCISRQLWWGHQIPAWYDAEGRVYVEETEEAARAAAGGAALTRDEDVLDTWFSSALWPFSTLGWPEATPELKRYYKTDVLVTGFDIIFFWVARMVMMGTHFMGEVPFHTVYIHALVRDEKGQKMSKSKGNVIDPLVLIDKYGADAMRFTLTAMAAQGRDIKLAESRVEGYRNFCTKLWNAARFTEMNGCEVRADFDPDRAALTVNRWVIGAVARTGAAVAEALQAYRFNDAAGALYQFTWGTFCDWYLEIIKPILTGPDGAAKDETRATCGWVLARLIELAHPIMPFITEELFQLRVKPALGGDFLMRRSWPDFNGLAIDSAAFDEIEWVVKLISEIRAARNEMNVPAAAKVPLILNGGDVVAKARLDTHAEAILRLARLESIATDGVVAPGSVQVVVGEATAVLPLAGIVDLDKERARLAKEKDKAAAEIAKVDARLGNTDFVRKAPEHVLEENRERRAAFVETVARLEDALRRLG